MPVNRFDQLYGQRYVSQYVPLPLEQVGELAKQYQQKSDLGKALPQQLDALDQALKAAPIHYDKKARLMSKYKGAINDLVSQAKPEDYAKPEYQNKIQNIVNSFKNDPEVNQIMNTKQWWDKEYVPYINDPDKSNQALIYDIHETSPGVYQQTDKEVSRLKVTPYEDREKAAWDIVGGIKEDSVLKESGYDFSKGMRVGPGGEHMAFNKRTGKFQGITENKLKNIVNHSIKSYGDSKAGKHHIQELLLNQGFGDEAYNYDYNKINTLSKKDPKYKKLKDYIDINLGNHLFDVGYKQVYSSTEDRIDNMTLKDEARARANIKAEEYTQNPQYRNPVNLPESAINAKSGLEYLGIQSEVINEKGEFDPSSFFSSRYEVTDAAGNKSIHYSSADAHAAAGKSGSIKQVSISKNDQQAVKELGSFYTNVLNTAKMMGIDIPKDNKGKNDYKKLTEILSKYGQNQMLSNTTSEGLQAKISNNVSSKLLGNVQIDDDGTTRFKASPIFSASKITEQGTGKQIIDSDRMGLAEDGVLSSINYFAKEPGTYRLDSQGNSYDFNPNEQVLKQMTKNTHGLTMKVMEGRKGKVTPFDVIGSDKDDNPITVQDAAQDIINNTFNNFKNIPANDKTGEELMKITFNELGKLEGFQPIYITSSDMRNQDGSSQYDYVVFQKKNITGNLNDPNNFTTEEKVLRKNREHGAIEVLTLGDIQQEESNYVQQNYLSGAYKK